MPASSVAFSPNEVAMFYAARVPTLPQTDAAEWRGPCPIHEGIGNNFAVDSETGKAYCHSQCGRGFDILALEMALTGARFPEAKAAVFALIGRADSRPEPAKADPWRTVAEYTYCDEAGRTLFQSVRQERGTGAAREKRFRQRRPDGAGGWSWDLKGVRSVPYRLPELLASGGVVYIAEGEKDVHTLEALGLVATCNPMGAGKWREEFATFAKGRHVCIIPDNDEPGRKHARAVAESLLPVAASVRVVELPGLPEKGDVSDWVAAGGTREALEALVAAAALFAALADHGIISRCMASIEAKPISWLWTGRMARGKLTVIAGNPGLGKSQLTASIAATVTTGGAWPVELMRCTPGGVIFLSAEDDPADTLRPRLEAAGADLNRIQIIEGVRTGYRGDGTATQRGFSLQADVEALGQLLEVSGDVAAVVIDPVTAYLGDVDSHKNADVRALLLPLSELAARFGVAVIAVSHLSKAAGQQALMRVNGSLAFVAAARAAFVVAADPEDKARRLFLPMKNNIGPDQTGLAFRIEGATVSSGAGPIHTSRIVWESEAVTITADEAIQPVERDEVHSALDGAKAFLGELLSDGAMSAKRVRQEANDAGHSWASVRRAQKALGVVTTKRGMGDGWDWSLPKMLKTREDAHADNVSTFGEVEHLRSGDAVAEVEL